MSTELSKKGKIFNDNTDSIKTIIDYTIGKLKEYYNVTIPFKTYNVRYNIGKSKYVVMFNDGIKTHKDGSKFYDINIFKKRFFAYAQGNVACTYHICSLSSYFK